MSLDPLLGLSHQFTKKDTLNNRKLPTRARDPTATQGKIYVAQVTKSDGALFLAMRWRFIFNM